MPIINLDLFKIVQCNVVQYQSSMTCLAEWFFKNSVFAVQRSDNARYSS